MWCLNKIMCDFPPQEYKILTSDFAKISQEKLENIHFIEGLFVNQNLNSFLGFYKETSLHRQATYSFFIYNLKIF